MDLTVIRKAIVAGVVGAAIGALTLIASGNFEPLGLAAAAAGGFVAGFGTVYAVPNAPAPTDNLDV